MDIRCPSCSKLFRVADEKIAGKGIRFKCSKCSEVITITKDDFEMDLLAREAEATEPVLQQTPQPATSPSQPSLKPVPPQPIPSPEPEAREYKPPQEHDIPPAALSDFDFSEPHAAATATAHPEEGFGGQDFSFNVEPEQESVREAGTSLEDTSEGEAALQFPDDLISEPKRTPAFGAPSVSETAAAGGSGLEPEQKTKTGPVFTPPSSKPVPDMQDEVIDLGAALAMPKEPSVGSEPAAADQDPGLSAAPMPKGPVITPELLAQMMKRSASSKSAAQAKAVPHADEDMDLGEALAMPKTSDTAGKEEPIADSAASRGSEAPSMDKRALIIGVTAFVLVLVLAALYYLGFLGGKTEQEALQKPQPVSQPKPQPARQTITPEGISIVDPVAFVDPERGDLVITGKIQNATDKPKVGWYLVTEVRDAKETVLSKAKMVNGIQIYSKEDQEILVKRGVKIEELRKKIASLGEGTISPKGSVPFEVRIMNPPAGSARFLPTLQSVELSSLVESTKALQGHQ
jgi:predicted Zn finger-like uncharacterized protein